MDLRHRSIFCGPPGIFFPQFIGLIGGIMVSFHSVQRAVVGAFIALALAACGAPASPPRNVPSETAVVTNTSSSSASAKSNASVPPPSPTAPTTAVVAPPPAPPAPVAPAPAAPAPAAPAPAPAPVVPAQRPAPVAPADPGPPASNMIQGIIPGAFCPNADVGLRGVGTNGGIYICGGKGADKNGHYHWNS